MQRLFTLFFVWFAACLMGLNSLISNGFAGDKVGGGGDASEARVNEIRNDILKWINENGSKELNLNGDLQVEEYNLRMKEVLAPKYVILGFVENDQSPEEELRVLVEGQPKTCRGFISRIDNRPHILCHISRFKKASDSEQYRLIHHEYAGLAGVEKNEGAASDYEISNQITDFLKEEKVLRLAIAKNERSVKLTDLVGTYKLKQGPGDCEKALRFDVLRDNLISFTTTKRKAVEFGIGTTKTKYDLGGQVDHTGRDWKSTHHVKIINGTTIKVKTTYSSAFALLFVPIPAGSESFTENFTPDENGLKYLRIDESGTLTCQYSKAQ